MPARRAYSSALRDQQAGLTRRRVLDAALRLFLADGYQGTTIEAVAREARVSTQTVYNAVGGKPALLRAVYDVTLAGDDAPVPIAELPAFADTIERQRATGTAMVASHVAERFGLRPGLTVQEAGDVLWTLTAPEATERLIVRRGWSADRAEAWLAGAMADALLGPG